MTAAPMPITLVTGRAVYGNTPTEAPMGTGIETGTSSAGLALLSVTTPGDARVAVNGTKPFPVVAPVTDVNAFCGLPSSTLVGVGVVATVTVAASTLAPVSPCKTTETGCSNGAEFVTTKVDPEDWPAASAGSAATEVLPDWSWQN